MARGDEPAAPVEIKNRCSAKGITIREYMATHIMAGMASLIHGACSVNAPIAVEVADALLAALAKEAEAK